MYATRKSAWRRQLLLPLSQVSIRVGCCSLYGPLILFLLLIPPLVLVWPGLVPLKLFQLWGWWGNLLDIARLFWPIPAIGLLLTLINIPVIRRRADIVLAGDSSILSGIWAGVWEELVFRWLLFYGALLCIPLANILTFGLLQWFYSTILGPLADFVTFHQLHAYLFSNQYGWVVGMAIISTNGGFRDGHSYQGPMGWAWSWFCGMFLFLMMFRYGLFAAIFAHSCYNLCVMTLAWLIARQRMTPDEARVLYDRRLEALQSSQRQIVSNTSVSLKGIVEQDSPDTISSDNENPTS